MVRSLSYRCDGVLRSAAAGAAERRQRANLDEEPEDVHDIRVLRHTAVTQLVKSMP